MCEGKKIRAFNAALILIFYIFNSAFLASERADVRQKCDGDFKVITLYSDTSRTWQRKCIKETKHCTALENVSL